MPRPETVVALLAEQGLVADPARSAQLTKTLELIASQEKRCSAALPFESEPMQFYLELEARA